MAKMLRVVQVRSGIGRPGDQRRTLSGLGLGRPNKAKVLQDTESIRGMLRKVQHLVRVEPVE